MGQPPVADRLRASERAEAPAPSRFHPHSFMHTLLHTEPVALDLLLAGARTVNRPDDHVIIQQGTNTSSMYLVNSGWAVATYNTPEGHSQVLRVYGPGDCFGYNAYGDPQPETVTALNVRTVTSLMILGRDEFVDRTQRLPIMLAYLHAQEQRLVHADQLARILTEPQGAIRLALLLLWLAARYGRAVQPGQGGGVLIGPPLRQTQLASWIGVSRETVARALRHWRLNGAVQTGRRSITVLDPAGLTGYRAFPEYSAYNAG